MSKTEGNSAKELTEAMEATMQRLQGRFKGISEQLESKIDEMGTRIDDLESDVSELMTQAGMEEQATSCHVTSKN
ncbi:heat shock factor-binding protein 1-like [Notothenia coriiceps]|uniref:Heat shock factor-binding protein 1-like n=1 Tax=Notothenia coriiceps TaxID=8208 RepID=A0A6I9P0Y1_9TELE|nr:PREDICTED: heat shock factor-binding protein 1-like [Notothenia coriiceps]